MIPVIFDYLEFSKFFRNFMLARSEKDQWFSYRWLAKKLGLKSTSILASIASGTRPPPQDLLVEMLRLLKFPDEEIAYAQAMSGFEHAVDLKSRDFYLSQMEKIKPQTSLNIVKESDFNLWRHWYSIAILEMFMLADFESNPSWISERLGFTVSTDEVSKAVDDLIAAGFIAKQDDGKWLRTTTRMSTDRFYRSDIINNFHLHLLDKAATAVVSARPESRYVHGVTMTIDAATLAEARSICAEFQTRIIKLMEANPGNETFHLAIQLFPLTTPLGIAGRVD